MKFNLLKVAVIGALLLVYLVEAANNPCEGSTGTSISLKCEGCTGLIICMGSTLSTKATCGSKFCNEIVGSGAATCVDEAPMGCEISDATTPSTTEEPSSTPSEEVTTTSTMVEVLTTTAETSTSTDATAPTTVESTSTSTAETTSEATVSTTVEVTSITVPETTTETTASTTEEVTSTTVAEVTSTTIQSTSVTETSTESTTLTPVSTILCTGAGIYPDPHNCSRYHYCPAYGQTSFNQICPPNYAFHHQSATTTFPCKQIHRPADCTIIDCTSSSIFKPYGTATTMYYAYCNTNSETELPAITMFKCSDGALFDGTRCVFKCPREGLFANTIAPTTYYQCYYAGRSLVYRLMNCPNRKTFKEKLQVCTSGA